MQTSTQQKNYTIKYYSRSDGKRVNRPYNPQRQYEFVAKNGNLIKCYWDEEKGDWRRSIIENIVSIKPIKNKTIPNAMRPRFRNKAQSNIYFLSKRKVSGEKKVKFLKNI